MKFVFTDEAGCMTFAKGPNISRYFLICTVQMDDCVLGAKVLNLRRRLAWNGLHLDADQFHATTDPEEVRDAMFDLLAKNQFRVDATLLEKSKAQPQLREDELKFYKHAWFFHFKAIGPRLLDPADNRLMLQTASIGTRKKRKVFLSAINDVVQQSIPGTEFRCSFWPSSTDPCLQVADYFAWAIQRAWEKGDRRRLEQIQDKVATQYDLFRSGKTHYY